MWEFVITLLLSGHRRPAAEKQPMCWNPIRASLTLSAISMQCRASLRLDFSSVFFRHGIRHCMLTRSIYWNMNILWDWLWLIKCHGTKRFTILFAVSKRIQKNECRTDAVPEENPSYNFAFSRVTARWRSSVIAGSWVSDVYSVVDTCWSATAYQDLCLTKPVGDT